jgi:tyrosyl-tRNA synthetase
MIQQNAVSLDGEKVVDVDMSVPARGSVLVKVGKRRFCQVVFE